MSEPHGHTDLFFVLSVFVQKIVNNDLNLT